jgi:hypothetical protein
LLLVTPSGSEYAPVEASLATASLDAAERRGLRRLSVCCERGSPEGLDAVWLFGRRVRGEPLQDESELQLMVLLRHSSRSDRVTALELLWQAALAERALQNYLSIRMSDRATPEHRRALKEFIAREIEPDGIALFARSGPAPDGACGPTSGEAAAES